jgi:lysophospholipase L1-like esterase
MNPWFYVSLGLVVVMLVFVSLFPRLKKQLKKEAEDAFLRFLLQNGFQQRVDDFIQFNHHVQPGGIVFVGDSITQEFQIHEYFSAPKLYNRGIGGDTTVGLLTRLESSIFALKPNTLILQIGTNDFSVLRLEPPETIANMTQVIQTIQHTLPNLKVILVSVYPLHEPTLNFGQPKESFRSNARIRMINEGIKKIPGVKYINLFDLLLDHQGQLNMALSRDGLHLNAKGYRIVADALKPFIEVI